MRAGVDTEWQPERGSRHLIVIHGDENMAVRHAEHEYALLVKENPAWENELVAFNNTDVDVPATVTVDGRVYRDVGVHFRGNSSFGVGNGYKRSLNLSFDFVHEKQAIGGYRTLNFLNANQDPTLMRTVLSRVNARGTSCTIRWSSSTS